MLIIGVIHDADNGCFLEKKIRVMMRYSTDALVPTDAGNTRGQNKRGERDRDKGEVNRKRE